MSNASTSREKPVAELPKAAWSPPRRALSSPAEAPIEGIVGLDRDGRCTFANRAGAEMLGLTEASMVGRPLPMLFRLVPAHANPRPVLDCPIAGIFHDGSPRRVERQLLWRTDGSSFGAEYTAYPIVEFGLLQGAVVTFVDIAERRRAEDLLLQANEELERRVTERTAELSRAIAELKGLVVESDAVRADERARIARDLHDEFGSLLVALKLDVEWLARRVVDRPELHAKCSAMNRLMTTAVEDLGRIVAELRPSALDHQGIWAALEWQALEFVEKTGLHVDLHLAVPDVEPPAGVEGDRWSIAVYRVFQEMLGNVARHARATSIAIQVEVDQPPGSGLRITVRDDGIGIDGAALARSRRYGVVGMRERAVHFGGSVTIEGAPGRGTCVRLSMPLPARPSIRDGG